MEDFRTLRIERKQQHGDTQAHHAGEQVDPLPSGRLLLAEHVVSAAVKQQRQDRRDDQLIHQGRPPGSPASTWGQCRCWGWDASSTTTGTVRSWRS